MAGGTIDELSIEVSSDASSAASDIGALADAMDRLRTGIGGSASKPVSYTHLRAHET